MTDHEPAVLLSGLVFPEGPRWHEGRLWFSDIRGHRVIAVDDAGVSETVAVVPRRPSGLGWLPDGRLLIVSMLDGKLLRREADGTLAVHAELPARPGSGTWNDMVVDDCGNAYVGHSGSAPAEREHRLPGVVALVRPDGSVTVVADDMKMPNGPALSEDGKTLIFAETFGRRLTAFDVRPDGTLANRREWANVYPALPDGICLDAEGAAWIASPRESEFQRIRPTGGVVARVLVPDRMAIACVLGGADRRTLYLCTARPPAKDGPRDTGRIETVRVEVPGAGRP